jgi:hypothetical protein
MRGCLYDGASYRRTISDQEIPYFSPGYAITIFSTGARDEYATPSFDVAFYNGCIRGYRRESVELKIAEFR